MAEPTLEELQQQIRDLQKLVRPTHTPFDGAEYSFPVVGQGINNEQFQLISRAAGTGIYVQHDAEGAQSPYRLVGMPGGDSETNAKNQMRLRVSSATNRSEASIEGFFHIQQEDMVIDFPAVSSPMTYHLCVTLDPEKESNLNGPIQIVRHDGPPPTSRRRKHILLYTVQREPNQLLTEAIIQQHKPWLGHVSNVWSYTDLPDPKTVEYGTFAIVINPGQGDGGRPELYTNRSGLGWIPIKENPRTYDITLRNGWENYAQFGNLKATLHEGWVTLSGVIRRGAWTGSRFANLPNVLAPARTRLIYGVDSQLGRILDVRVTDTGDLSFGSTPGSSPNWVSFDGVSYPLND